MLNNQRVIEMVYLSIYRPIYICYKYIWTINIYQLYIPTFRWCRASCSATGCARTTGAESADGATTGGAAGAGGGTAQCGWALHKRGIYVIFQHWWVRYGNCLVVSNISYFPFHIWDNPHCDRILESWWMYREIIPNWPQDSGWWNIIIYPE